MKKETLQLTHIANNGNGNPRYVAHFLNLNTRAEIDVSGEDFARIGGISGKYALALKRARTIGGSKFNNKRYGGGIVFIAYSLPELVAAINRVTGRAFDTKTIHVIEG